MGVISLLLVCFIGAVHGRQVQIESGPKQGDKVQRTLRTLLLSLNPGSNWRQSHSRPTARGKNDSVDGSHGPLDKYIQDLSHGPVDRYRGVEQLKYRPAWRGNLHKYGSFIYPLFAAKLMRDARSRATAGTALLFSVAVEGIMAVSAILHKVKWQRQARLQLARFCDYSMIFLGIALLYQSLGASLMGHTQIFRRAILPLVWGGAAVGIGTKAVFLNQPRWVEALAFLAQGWACMLGASPMRKAVTDAEWRLVLGGGLSITAGVAAYTSQWPDFAWHRAKFRAHEAFHLSTLGMFACFYCAMDSLVRRL